MDFLTLFIVGLVMGLLGGLLGIGGSVIMIPALTFLMGENQHLYQASAMICNFFVSASSLIGHYKAKAFNVSILKWLIPLGVAGIVGGVAVSNSRVFEGSNGYLLARLFGAFLVYVVIYNSFRLFSSVSKKNEPVNQQTATVKANAFRSSFCGLITGLAAGLMGIGAGTVSTPLQQVTMKRPLREAMSNSAVMIVAISWIGAVYKNATLAQHGLHFAESFRIAICVIPGSMIGGYFGGHLMHGLPKNLVRGAFIVVCIIAAIKLLTVARG